MANQIVSGDNWLVWEDRQLKVNGIPLTGKVVQVVNTQYTTYTTCATDLPRDDTIPQNTEGDEVMTLAITPTSATNYLKIDVVIHMGASAADGFMTAALFQDTTANALSVGSGSSSQMIHFVLR